MSKIKPSAHGFSRLVLAAVIAGLGSTVEAAAPPQARDLAFVHANVITMADATVLTDQSVLVRDGRIVSIGPTAKTSTGGLEEIDASGRYILPGLAEMHAHVPLPEDRGMPSGYRDDVLTLWVANGVTLARGMLGHSSHLALRESLANHEILGPRLYTSGPSFSGQSVTDIPGAVARLRAQQQAGYDFAKLHPGLSRAAFDAIAAEARVLDFPFGGHVPVDVGLRRALEAGQISIDHLDGYVHALVADPASHGDAMDSFFGAALVPFADATRIGELVERTRAAGAWAVPTESFIENVVGDVAELLRRLEIAYLPKPLLARYRASMEQRPRTRPEDAAAFLALRKRLILALHDGGAGLVLGSDSPQIFNVPGFAIHRELTAMVAAGLTPYEALRTGTVNPARFFGAEETLGALRVGRVADFVMLSANPLDDVAATSAIEGVMLRGRWLSREFLDAALADIRSRYAAQP